MRWAYKTVLYPLKKDGFLGDSFLDEEEMERSLNEYGKAGWELVAFVEVAEGFRAIFKYLLEEGHRKDLMPDTASDTVSDAKSDVESDAESDAESDIEPDITPDEFAPSASTLEEPAIDPPLADVRIREDQKRKSGRDECPVIDAGSIRIE